MSSIIPEAAEIRSFDSDGKPQYAFESTDGHCYWDVCNCKKCLASQTDDTENLKPRKKKSSGRILKERWEKGHKEVAPLGQPLGKFDYLVKYSPPPKAEPVIPIGLEDQQPPAIPPVLPSYKKAMKWLKVRGELVPSPSPVPVPIPQICMFSFVSSYDEEFPELTSFADKI